MRLFASRLGVLALAMPWALAACDASSPAKVDAPAAVSSTAAADLAAIKAIQAQALRGYKEQNVSLISANHAEDIVVIVPGQKPIVGREAVAKSTAGEMAPGSTMDFDADKIEVAESGDLAYARGDYSYSYVDPQTKKTMRGGGAYIAVFKKQADGTWKVAEEISSNGPEA